MEDSHLLNLWEIKLNVGLKEKRWKKANWSNEEKLEGTDQRRIEF